MVYLLDTNIIIRFLIRDNEELFEISKNYFLKIERLELKAEILPSVLMEAFFVLTKFYKLNKKEVILDLKTLLSLDRIVNSDKIISYEALSIMENKNIDFVDALICAKSKLENYKKLSFDKDLKKC